jgi:long-subunit fatty acid transport protein
MKKIFLILSLSFICIKTQGQKKPENQLGTWYMYNGSHKLSERYSLKTMAHFRYFELASEFQQEIYRLGINYTFTPKTNVTLGVSYATADVAYDASSVNLYESRFYEDLNLKSNWRKFTVKHRFRFEQRFIHKNIDTDQFQNWLRYDLNLSYPLSNTWSTFVFNEIFLNLNSAQTFSQNWTGIGFLYKWNNNIKLKMAYLQIKTPDIVLKRIQLGIILNANFTKKPI